MAYQFSQHMPTQSMRPAMAPSVVRTNLEEDKKKTWKKDTRFPDGLTHVTRPAVTSQRGQRERRKKNVRHFFLGGSITDIFVAMPRARPLLWGRKNGCLNSWPAEEKIGSNWSSETDWRRRVFLPTCGASSRYELVKKHCFFFNPWQERLS